MKFAFLEKPGALRISGPDRAAFLQRQTSNNVNLLKPGKAILTVLTSPQGRILDVLLLVDQGAAILALTLPGRSRATARFLGSRIFFMDKVSLEDVSAAYLQAELWGPYLPGLPAAVGHTAVYDPEEAGATLIRHETAFGLGWRLIAPAQAAPRLGDVLAANGAAPSGLDGLELERVEAGLPGVGELTDAYNPLEVGLAAVVSPSKGCYTGQEVLARQVTYDKVTRTLVRLRTPALLAPGERLHTLTGDPAGQVTSAVVSPTRGPLALAVVRRAFSRAGTAFAGGAVVD